MTDIQSEPKQLNRINILRIVILITFIGLATLYNIVTPIGESFDESRHYGMVDTIADTGELPVQGTEDNSTYQQEGSQPPLYYMVTTLLVSPIERDVDLEFNPFAKIGIGNATDNQNMLIHNEARESFPWQGTTLAMMIGRFFSILLASITVWFIFDIARLVVPQQPWVALIAMSLTAFNPMFLFISASINNDNMVTTFSTLTLALLLRQWRNGWNWRGIMLMSILLGLAGLSKLSGLTLAPVVGFTLIAIYLREKRPLKDLVIAGAMCISGILIIAGWWYVRNIDLYGDITGLNAMLDVVGRRPEGFGLDDLLSEYEGFFYAFWGWFGGLTVLAPQYFYDGVSVVTVIGIIGLVIYLLRNRQPILYILIFHFLVTFIGVIRWTLQTPASQGRLLFPAIAAISILLAIGIWQSFERLRLSHPMYKFTMVIILLFYALTLPFFTIMPAYEPTDSFSGSAGNRPLNELNDDTINRVDIVFGDIEFIGYKASNIITADDSEDQFYEVQVYWRPLRQTETHWAFFIQLFAPDDNLEPVGIASLDTFPGRGLRLTTTWQPDQIYSETYRLKLEKNYDELTPYQPRFRIGWYDFETKEEIPAQDSAGNSIDAVIGRGGSIASTCDAPSSIVATWENFTQLTSVGNYDDQVVAGESFSLDMSWFITGDTPDTYNVFVQVVNPNDITEVVGNGDRSPRDNWYPTTAWQPLSCFDDTYQVVIQPDAPAGAYDLLIGFYEPSTGRRVPVRDGITADSFKLDSIEITE